MYRNLARLAALQRLVVIDACQAEAIHEDPAVRRIREAIDTGARRARTAYVLAARRGEPAGEDSAIEHGLLTYVLLRGTDDRGLKAVPEVTVFRDLPSADRNGDRLITSDELGWYADATLPRFAAGFPRFVMRDGTNGKPPEPVRPAANLDQAPRVQGTDASFPIVEVPDGTPPPASPLP